MKHLYIAFITILSLTNLNAQKRKIRFGERAGLNISSINFDDSDDFGEVESRTGFHIGGFLEIPISKKLSIQPEIIFSTQGFVIPEREIFDVVTPLSELKNNYDYLNIPIIVKFYVYEGFSIQAGPQFSFLTSAEQESTNDFTGTISQDVSEFINNVDFGLNFGLGYQLGFGLFIDIRYNLGLRDVFVFENPNSPTETFGRNRVFQISAGYKF